MKKTCCVDLEASSAAKNGWPTELGWSFPFGGSGSFLIYPEREWIGCDPVDPEATWEGWGPVAEKLTGINQVMLLKNGISCDLAAKRFLEATANARLLSDAPEFDFKWLHQIFEAAGFNKTPKLLDFEIIYADVARRPGHVNMSEAIYKADRSDPHTHRAEDDAKNLSKIIELLNPR